MLTVATTLEGLPAFDSQFKRPASDFEVMRLSSCYVVDGGPWPCVGYSFYTFEGVHIDLLDVTEDMIQEAIQAFTKKGQDNAAQRQEFLDRARG